MTAENSKNSMAWQMTVDHLVLEVNVNLDMYDHDEGPRRF